MKTTYADAERPSKSLQISSKRTVHFLPEPEVLACAKKLPPIPRDLSTIQEECPAAEWAVFSTSFPTEKDFFFEKCRYFSGKIVQPNLMDESHSDSEAGSEDSTEKLAFGTVEVVGAPAGGAGAVSGELSAAGIGGEGSASGSGGSDGKTGLAGEAAGTGGSLAVGDGESTGARGVGSVTDLTLLAETAVGGSGGGRGLLGSWPVAVSDGGGTGWDGLSARTGVVGGNTTRFINNVVLAATARGGRPGPVGGVSVGTGVVLDVLGDLGQRSSACVGSKRSSADFTGSPVEAGIASVGGTATHAVLGSNARGGSGGGNQASSEDSNKDFHC